jgi:predicted thioredoxin/glutaredoxin
VTVDRAPTPPSRLYAGIATVPVDARFVAINNSYMSTEAKPILDTDDEALMERVLHGKPLDPEVYRRIREEGDRITEEIRRQQGMIEIAVDLIREIRDEE